MSHSLDSTWATVLDEVEKSVSKPSFETWLKSTVLLECNEHSATIGVPNSFTQDWLEKNYVQLVTDALTKVTKKKRIIRFIVPQAIKDNDSFMPERKPMDVMVTEETYLPS